MDNLPNIPTTPNLPPPNRPSIPTTPNLPPPSNRPSIPTTPSLPPPSNLPSIPTTPNLPPPPKGTITPPVAPLSNSSGTSPHNSGGNGSVTPRDVLMKRIQVCDFICDEVGLYLDTHPTDKTALDYFAKYLEMKKVACAEYNKNYGPLTTDAYIPGEPWKWVESPWPWERGI